MIDHTDARELALHADSIAGGLTAFQRDMLDAVAEGADPYASRKYTHGVTNSLRVLERHGAIVWTPDDPNTLARLTPLGELVRKRLPATACRE